MDLPFMPSNNQHIGPFGEWASLIYLQFNGLKLITKNYRCRYGEIDLIMTSLNQCIFVEVKSRTSTSFYNPLFSISPLKQQRIIKTSEHFLEKNPLYQYCNIRYDAVLVNLQRHSIDWIPDAFTPQIPF